MGAPPVSPSFSLCFLANAVDPFDAGVCVSMLPDLCISVFCSCLPWLALVARGKECQELMVGLPAVSGSPFVHHMAFGMHRLPMMSASCSSSC